MLTRNRKTHAANSFCRSLFITSLVTGMALWACLAAAAQSPTPTPSNSEDITWGGYRVKSAMELGWRWRRVSGNENEYRSHLNYKQGFRSFDSSLLLERESGRGRMFDSFLFTNSGWGSDPQGSTRVNIEKAGAYRFTSNVRQVTYFNNIFNFVNPVGFANSEHYQNTKHTFGDFDVIAMPENERFRMNFGVSFNNTSGFGGSTERFFSDEFPIDARLNNKSIDFRIGAEGKVLGFDWGITQGFVTFKDRPSYSISAPNQGNTTTNQSRLDTLIKTAPTKADSRYTGFRLHRMFADKLEFTGRLMYSSITSRSTTSLMMTGRDNTNPTGNIVRSDIIDAASFAKRPQTRGDIGLTYAVTDKFRISDTFTFDQFAVNGTETFQEVWVKATGTPLTQTTRSTGIHVNAYRRFANTIEGDYQFNKAVGLHIGYRYTRRQIENSGYNLTFTSTISNPAFNCTPRGVNQNPIVTCDDERNSTNSVIAGMKLRPVKNWTLYWDVEHGEADNVFTRLENYMFTNFRIRNRLTVHKFTLHLDAITRDNENPSSSTSVIVPPAIDYVTNIKNRYFSGSVDWEPDSRVLVSGGYTYRHFTSYTPVVLPVSGATGGYVFGFSQFFIRDRYGFIDVSVKAAKRLSLYGSYRLDIDKGQGSRVSSPITVQSANFITSYPMRFTTPEFRAAIRLTRNVDWNLGYQYYKYSDTFTPFQNYRAHLPYTSLRIYFGSRAVDR